VGLRSAVPFARAFLKAKLLRGRTPLIVSWLVTRRCNYRCGYCDSWRTPSPELPTDEVCRLIDEFASEGTRQIIFTGGEPLVKDGIEQIVERCTERGIRVGINSNGALVPKMLPDLDGLRTLTLSLDGPEAVQDKLRGQGCLRDVMNAIEAAQSRGLRLRLLTVLSSENLDHISFVLETARAAGARVFFQPATQQVLRGEHVNPYSPEPAAYKRTVDDLIAEKRSGQYGSAIAHSVTGLRYLRNSTEQQAQLTPDELTADAAPRPGRPSLQKWAKWILALAVTVGIFVILLRKIPIRDVADALRGARMTPILGAVALSVIIKVFIGADKWRRILAALSCRVSFGEATFVRTANAPLRITPGKLGTLLAAVYLSRHRGLPFAKGVSSLMLERLQNLAVLLAFVLFGPMVFEVAAPAQLNHLSSGRALLASVTCVVVLVALYAFRGPLYALMARMNVKLANVVRDLASCFHQIRPGRQAGLLLYAAAAQAGELTMGYLILRAVGVSAPFGTVFVGLALIVVISNIPVTVLGFGTRELTVVYLFGGYGTQPELLAVGVLISAIGYIIPCLSCWRSSSVFSL